MYNCFRFDDVCVRFCAGVSEEGQRNGSFQRLAKHRGADPRGEVAVKLREVSRLDLVWQRGEAGEHPLFRY